MTTKALEVVAVRCRVDGCIHRNRIYPRAAYENPVSYCHGEGHTEDLVRLIDAQKAIEAAREEGRKLGMEQGICVAVDVCVEQVRREVTDLCAHRVKDAVLARLKRDGEGG